MKQTINFSAFVDAFHKCGRYDQFGYNALRVLFDYLEEVEQDTGEEIELDVIALCCDYNADSWQDIATSYNIDTSVCEDDATRMSTVIEWLNENTVVCGTYYDSIIYCSAF